MCMLEIRIRNVYLKAGPKWCIHLKKIISNYIGMHEEENIVFKF